MKTITHPIERWFYATWRDEDNCWKSVSRQLLLAPADEPIRVVSVLNPSWTDQQIRDLLDKLVTHHQKEPS